MKEQWNVGMMEDGPCVDCRYAAVDQIVAKKAEKWRMGGQLPGGMMECWNIGLFPSFHHSNQEETWNIGMLK